MNREHVGGVYEFCSSGVQALKRDRVCRAAILSCWLLFLLLRQPSRDRDRDRDSSKRIVVL